MILDLPMCVKVLGDDRLASPVIAGGIDGPPDDTKRLADHGQSSFHVSRQEQTRQIAINSTNSQAKWIEVSWNDSLQI